MVKNTQKGVLGRSDASSYGIPDPQFFDANKDGPRPFKDIVSTAGLKSIVLTGLAIHYLVPLHNMSGKQLY